MTMEKLEEKTNYKFLKGKKIPEGIQSKLKQGDLLIKARTLTEDFLPEKWLRELAEDSINQRVLWRHRDPENPEAKGVPFGRVLSADVSKMENGKHSITRYLRIFGDNEETLKLQELIKMKHETEDDIGISKGFMVNKDKNGDIYRVFALEDSITYIPKCKQCKTQEVIEMEKEKNIQTLTDEITKLQDELNGLTVKLEDKDAALKEATDKIAEVETSAETKEKEKDSIADQLLDTNDKVHKLEDEIQHLQKKPYLDILEKLEDPEIFELEKKRDVDWLIKRIAKKQGQTEEPTIVTTTLEDEKEGLEDDEKKDLGTTVFRNNPLLQKQINQMLKGDS